MIEVPQLRVGNCSLKFCCLGCAALHGEARDIRPGHHGQASLLVDNLKEDSPCPCFRIRISEIANDVELPVSAGEIGESLDCNVVHKRFRRDQQLNWPVLDATGLEGGWDFTFYFSAIGQLQGGGDRRGGEGATEGASDPTGALSLLDALPKQLGLKLEMQKRPLPVLVIDHIEQKPTDN